jgi:hypothetical protein
MDKDKATSMEEVTFAAEPSQTASFSRLARRYHLATSWLPEVHRAFFSGAFAAAPGFSTPEVAGSESTFIPPVNESGLESHEQVDDETSKSLLPLSSAKAKRHPAQTEATQLAEHVSLQSGMEPIHESREANHSETLRELNPSKSSVWVPPKPAGMKQSLPEHARGADEAASVPESDADEAGLAQKLDTFLEKESSDADVACALPPMSRVAGPTLVWNCSRLERNLQGALGMVHPSSGTRRMQADGTDLVLSTLECADKAAVEVSAHCEATFKYGSLGKALATASRRSAFFQDLAARYASSQDDYGEIIARLWDAVYGTSATPASAHYRFSAWLREVACPKMQSIEEWREAWHREQKLHPEMFARDNQALDEALFELSGGQVLAATKALQQAGDHRLALLLSQCLNPSADIATDVASQLETWEQDGLSEPMLGPRRLDLFHLLAGRVQRAAGHALNSLNRSPWFCGPHLSWIRAFALFFWYARSAQGQEKTTASSAQMSGMALGDDEYESLDAEDDAEDAAALRALLRRTLSLYDASWQSVVASRNNGKSSEGVEKEDPLELQAPASPPPLPPMYDQALRCRTLSRDAVFPVTHFDAVYVLLHWYCQAPALWSPRYQLSPECFGISRIHALDFRLVWLLWECMRCGQLRQVPEDWIDPALRAQCYEGYALQLELAEKPLEALYVRASWCRGPDLLAYLCYLWPRLIRSGTGKRRVYSMIGHSLNVSTELSTASSRIANALAVSALPAARWLYERVHVPWSWMQLAHYQWLRYELTEVMQSDVYSSGPFSNDVAWDMRLRLGELGNAMLNAGLALLGARDALDAGSVNEAFSNISAVAERPSGDTMESEDSSTVAPTLDHSTDRRVAIACSGGNSSIAIQLHLSAAVHLAPLQLLQCGLGGNLGSNESVTLQQRRMWCARGWKQVLRALQLLEQQRPGSLAVPSPTRAAALEFKDLGGLVLDWLALREHLGAAASEEVSEADPLLETPVATLYRRLQLLEEIRESRFDLEWIEAFCARIQRFAETMNIPSCRETPALRMLIQHLAAVAGRLVCFWVVNADPDQSAEHNRNQTLSLERARALIETLPLLRADRHLLASELEGSCQSDLLQSQRWLLRDPLRALRF